MGLPIARYVGLACVMVWLVAAQSSTLLPLDQILQTTSIPSDILSIFTHYFPTSLWTDYSAVSHELSILMDTDGVTAYDYPHTDGYPYSDGYPHSYGNSRPYGYGCSRPYGYSHSYGYGTASKSAEKTSGLTGSLTPSTAATPTAVTVTLSSAPIFGSETTTPPTLPVTAVVTGSTPSASATERAASTSPSTSSTTTAGATSFVGLPSCLGIIVAMSVALVFGTLV
ncbi:hypothetical protein V1517DRAFT_322970 [Lipomyces orientalis]|uniref:Uncharacterized protein n=1 Tax=Lipomyces orientalis TaxID=1233043 RepID=A0ACC3TN32_9ASCO